MKTQKQEYAILLATSIYQRKNSISPDDAYRIVSKWSMSRVEAYIRENRK